MQLTNYGFLDIRASRLVTHNRAGGLCLGGVHLRSVFQGHGDRDLSYASQLKPIINYTKLA